VSLAKKIEIETADHLGGAGYDLLQEWASEQGLEGFYGSTTGTGSEWRQKLTEAVAEGLDKGHVARPVKWKGWNFFREHLGIYDAGPRERSTLTNILTHADIGNFPEIWDFLLSNTGQTLWQESESEREIHAALRANSSIGLRHLLDTILAYENFSRLLQDAFDDCLEQMSRLTVRVHSQDLAELLSVKKTAEEVPHLYVELLERLAEYQQAHRFMDNFSAFLEQMEPSDWVQTLLDHHIRVQSRKPPNGKAPWLERFDDNSLLIRPGYMRAEGGQHDQEYVHMYRCSPLMSFASDLGHLD